MPCEYSDLNVTPSHLKFQAEQGTHYVLPQVDLFIKKVGEGVLSPSWDIQVEAQGEVPWITLRPMHGRGPKRVRVKVDPRHLKAGVFTAEITIASHVSVTPETITVKLTVIGVPEPPPTEPTKPPVEKPELPEPPKPPEPPEPPPQPPPAKPEESRWQRLLKWLLGLFRRAA